MIQQKRSTNIRARFDEAQRAMELARHELQIAADAADQDAIDAIVAGRDPKPGLRERALAIQSTVAELEASLAPLESAFRIVEQQESEAKAKAEQETAEALKADYRKASEEVIKAALKLAAAQEAADVLFKQIPLGAGGNYAITRVHGSILLNGPESVTNFVERMCQSGYGHAVPADHIGRRRHEHQMAHDEGRRTAAIAEVERHKEVIRQAEERQATAARKSQDRKRAANPDQFAALS